MTDSHWGGILQTGSTKVFTDEFRKALSARLSAVESAEALTLLYGIRSELLKEISAGRRIPEEIGRLIASHPQIECADQLQVSLEEFIHLAAELYHTRASVSSTFALARSFYDSLLRTAFDHAVTLLKSEGKIMPALTSAVLVSGEMGRGESILGSRSSFFFIYQDVAGTDLECVSELAMRFMAVLSLCFPAVSRNLSSASSFWYGSAAQWHDTVAELLRGEESGSWEKSRGKSFALLLETAADMRPVCGDPGFARSVLAGGRSLLTDCMRSENFWHLAKDVSSMPVALGIFGRFKTVRSGKNSGKFDLKAQAIDPLAAAARVLALSSGGAETSFTARMKSVLAAGNIGVALADRLLIAYQDFMRERIRLELAGGEGADGLFFNPDDLDDGAKERFREGLEDITTLQRLVHQQLVEVSEG